MRHIESALPRLLGICRRFGNGPARSHLQNLGLPPCVRSALPWLHRAILGQRSQLCVDDFPQELAWERQGVALSLGSGSQSQQLRRELAEVAFAPSSPCIGASQQVCLPASLFGIITALPLVACTNGRVRYSGAEYKRRLLIG